MYKHLEQLDFNFGEEMFRSALDLKNSDKYHEYMVDEFESEFDDLNELDEVIAEFYDLVQSLTLYKSEGYDYIELADDQIDFGVGHLKLTDEDYVQLQISQQVYLDDACLAFTEKTNSEVYLLGRSGRHVCVDCNFDNALRFEELCEVQKNLQARYIEDIQNEAKKLAKGK